MIWRLKPKLPLPPEQQSVVATLPTSTTNITGFFIIVRGSSFTIESDERAPYDLRVPQALAFVLCHKFVKLTP